MAFANFLAELKRRHVYRAGGAYAVAAFGLIEIVSNVAPMFDLPNWVGRAVVFVLITGFPLTLLAAWLIEAKPAEGAQAPSSTRLDFVLVGALVLVVGLLIYQQVAPAQKSANVAASDEGVSIAVLPFVNLSSDKEQEFFSDGMTEEITSALAKVKGLQVVGRTSAFEFKGQNKDLRTIGQALGATNLLEGSVRKEGNHIRVTGQLIRADNGHHIWTDNYDRELTSVFAIQDDIARAIAAALQVPLGLAEGERLVANRATDAASYEDYLRARALYRGRDVASAIALLEKSVAADPNYAPAWAMLAENYALGPIYAPRDATAPKVYDPESIRSYSEKAERTAQQALRLDPHNALAHAALAQVASNRHQWSAVDDHYQQALAIAPDDPDILNDYSSATFLGALGYVKRALMVRDKLRTLEPFVPVYNVITGIALISGGQYKAAADLLQAAPPGYQRNNYLSFALAGSGRFREAADALLATTPDQIAAYSPAQPWASRAAIEDTARLLRSAPGTSLLDTTQLVGAHRYAYAFVGAPERFFESIDDASRSRVYTVWAPAFAPLRKTEQFKAFAREVGYVDYWRARGWPDLCHPVGADDFACD